MDSVLISLVWLVGNWWCQINFKRCIMCRNKGELNKKLLAIIIEITIIKLAISITRPRHY